jgi:heptosyltransferase-3
MKKRILVIQLARLGDIYQSWPVMNALHRSGHEVHLLTREKFSPAANGCTGVFKQWTLDSRTILKTLIDEKPDIDASLSSLSATVDALKAENFDTIVNLSFSPFSSYLTDAVSNLETEVRGYSRFNDGSLSIPDDASAYFFGQVGRNRGNRVHLTEIFASVAGVDLIDSDWNSGSIGEIDSKEINERIGANPLVIHVGASDLAKTFSWSKWLQIVRGLVTGYNGEVVLIGSGEEVSMAEKISSISGPKQVVNLVGKTSLGQLFSIIANAKVLIGGDSAPVQIASLTGTPVFNVSFPSVSLWETGPRSAGSRILPVTSEDAVASDEIVREVIGMAAGKATQMAVVSVPGVTMPYVDGNTQGGHFEWELLKALYMDATFPPPPNETFLLAVQRLGEVNSICLEQIDALARNPKNSTASLILDRGDEIMNQIEQMIPEAGPMVRWFQVERLRIGPMAVANLIDATRAVHRRLGQVLAVYGQVFDEAGGTHDDVNLG